MTLPPLRWRGTPVGSGGFRSESFITGEVFSGGSPMLLSDQPPTNTQGDEYLTLSITPDSATDILEIKSRLFFSQQITEPVIIALFQDAIINALATGVKTADGGPVAFNSVSLFHKMVAGTTNQIDFKIRAGNTSVLNILTINGENGFRRLGGTLSSFINVKIIPGQT